ncbi:MAG: OTU domain-containing protein [Pseudomonadota bacterium]
MQTIREASVNEESMLQHVSGPTLYEASNGVPGTEHPLKALTGDLSKLIANLQYSVDLNTPATAAAHNSAPSTTIPPEPASASAKAANAQQHAPTQTRSRASQDNNASNRPQSSNSHSVDEATIPEVAPPVPAQFFSLKHSMDEKGQEDFFIDGIYQQFEDPPIFGSKSEALETLNAYIDLALENKQGGVENADSILPGITAASKNKFWIQIPGQASVLCTAKEVKLHVLLQSHLAEIGALPRDSADVILLVEKAGEPHKTSEALNNAAADESNDAAVEINQGLNQSLKKIVDHDSGSTTHAPGALKDLSEEKNLSSTSGGDTSDRPRKIFKGPPRLVPSVSTFQAHNFTPAVSRNTPDIFSAAPLSKNEVVGKELKRALVAVQRGTFLESENACRPGALALDANRFSRIENNGGGDCLFHSLEGSDTKRSLTRAEIKRVRREISDVLRRKPDAYLKNRANAHALSFAAEQMGYRAPECDEISNAQYAVFQANSGTWAGTDEVCQWLELPRNHHKTVVILDAIPYSEAVSVFTHVVDAQTREIDIAVSRTAVWSVGTPTSLSRAQIEQVIADAIYGDAPRNRDGTRAIAPNRIVLYATSGHFTRVTNMKTH